MQPQPTGQAQPSEKTKASAEVVTAPAPTAPTTTTPVQAPPIPAPVGVVSTVENDVTKTWSEVEQFLHKAISEVATNAHGFTSSVADKVTELEAEIVKLKTEAENVAKVAAPVVAAAEADPTVKSALTDVVTHVAGIEGRLVRIETVAKPYVQAIANILSAVGGIGA